MLLSARSIAKLKDLKPKLVSLVKRAAEIADNDPNCDFEIVQGNRTQAQQDALFAQGRTKPGKIVTWTRNSKHIGGGAIDFAALDNNGKISWNDKLYPPIASCFIQASKELGIGITWGGTWTAKDWGHIQLNPALDGEPSRAEVTVDDTIIPVPTYHVIKRGMQNDLVKSIQSILKLGGYFKFNIDGAYGRLTEAAVKAFQYEKGLKVDGTVGPMTMSALKKLEDDFHRIVTDDTEIKYPEQIQPGPDYNKIVRFYEGEKLRAYKIGGHWTIGVGHSESSGLDPIPYEGMIINRDQLEAIFKADTDRIANELRPLIKVPLKQHQFDALLSLYFNRPRTFQPAYTLPSGVQPADDLLDAINALDWNRAYLEFAELISAPALDGKVYPGLVARRMTEATCFSGRQYELG